MRLVDVCDCSTKFCDPVGPKAMVKTRPGTRSSQEGARRGGLCLRGARLGNAASSCLEL